MTTGKGSKKKNIAVVTDGKSAKDDMKDTSVILLTVQTHTK